jgi:hypothetical protein
MGTQPVSQAPTAISEVETRQVQHVVDLPRFEIRNPDAAREFGIQPDGRPDPRAGSMVDIALKTLAEQNVVELDEERKAAMVSNLLVVLCGETEAHPVINTGSLYN